MEITLNQLPQNVQQLIAAINGANQTLTITDAGKPLAIISPVTKQKRAAFGCMKNTMQIVENIVAPVVPESEWEVKE
ncbi:type II toxin-antitoxin system Phd/YefM family antitoxin [Planktothricoides raciborskii]|uniref:Antitoxin n=1 Tax=Planktothricoides raciborskii FACHB-1370 TaxID=2949576 RepID=A0ABR8EMX0_9CYAN|nr:hypothetical protein [Planktothricoides raciborskii]MBD2547245.1 hypothetical protein [Planktothricoides raciborskii FACHB-1370]MBD2585747.1 hypothetical protein [Planktothricoides raciborskii FACHB-1261]